MFQLESKKIRYQPSPFAFLGMGGTHIVSVRLSTVKLPGDHGYETCIFYHKGGSDVLERYDTVELAIEGHRDLTIIHGLKYSKFSL